MWGPTLTGPLTDGPAMPLTCEGAGGDVQPRSREEVGPHVLQVAVDEGGIHLEHLEHGGRLLLPGGAPAEARARKNGVGIVCKAGGARGYVHRSAVNGATTGFGGVYNGRKPCRCWWWSRWRW